MNTLYLITYKHDNGNVISQFLAAAKTKEGAMERIEKKYNPNYYSISYLSICQTRDNTLIQIL